MTEVTVKGEGRLSKSVGCGEVGVEANREIAGSRSTPTGTDPAQQLEEELDVLKSELGKKLDHFVSISFRR